MIADQWGISREDLDAFSVQSHQRAARATEEGRFENEIVPVAVHDEEGKDTDEILAADEGIRPDSTVETLANLKPAFKEDGKVTAGNSSQITDGSSAVLIMSEEKANALGLRPRARFHAFALAGVDPVTMLTGPIPATTSVLERAKLTLDDIDAVEINEAFASVVLAWEKEHHPDMEKVNPNGGAIALGHPLGASGGKLMATLLNELERTNGRWGLLTMCEGGGLANAHGHRAAGLTARATSALVDAVTAVACSARCCERRLASRWRQPPGQVGRCDLDTVNGGLPDPDDRHRGDSSGVPASRRPSESSTVQAGRSGGRASDGVADCSASAIVEVDVRRRRPVTTSWRAARRRRQRTPLVQGAARPGPGAAADSPSRPSSRGGPCGPARRSGTGRPGACAGRRPPPRRSTTRDAARRPPSCGAGRL